jgi:hypothetical protein
MSSDGPVTYKTLFTLLAAAAVALVTGSLVFGNSVVSRAEAASVRTEDRLESRLTRIEDKVDRVLERVGSHEEEP